MIRHVNIKIYGRVQGVFFRWAAKERADELGVAGFARNEPDDSVYIEAEGEEENLEKFLAWCHKGSPLADVAKVEHEHSDSLRHFSDFSVI